MELKNEASLVFLSYKTENIKLANDVRHYLIKKKFGVWLDRTNLQSGMLLREKIKEAIALHVSHLVALVTTEHIKSVKENKLSWVAYEILSARRHGICILLVLNDISLNDLPQRFRKWKHIPWQQTQKRKEILSYLQEPCKTPRYAQMAPTMPPEFIPRDAEFKALQTALMEKENAPVAISTALVGAGGFGKTWLAVAICHDEEIQDRYCDDILWITLGEKPSDQFLLSKIKELIQSLSEESIPDSFDASRSKLAELLEKRDILLVIDDVWRQEDLKPFLGIGANTVRLLITTRNRTLLPTNALAILVDEMQLAEAVALLSAGLTPDDSEKIGLERLAKLFGCWPLLLTLANGRLRRVTGSNMSLFKAIESDESLLKQEGLLGFDITNENDRNRLASFSLNLSIELLADLERSLFSDLGIFPEDTDIPLVEIHRLWRARAGWKETQGDELLRKLLDLSLLQRLNFESGVVRLHDIIRTHLRDLHIKNLPKANRQYLDSFQMNRWADLLMTETYLFEHLQWHLEEAERGEDWLMTLRDLQFLAAKAVALQSGGMVVADLVDGLSKTTNDKRLALLLQRLRPIAHRLDVLDKSLVDARTFLAGYFDELQEKEELFANWPATSLTHLKPIPPLSDTPHQAMFSVMTGHKNTLWVCHFSPDGELLLSSSDDKTLRLWSA